MPCYTNFFWATFFILYDPLEFSTGACPTPSGLEIGKTHHCALFHAYCMLNNSHLIYKFLFQGSGNTWARYLIQQASGYATGCIYNDGALKKGN